MMARLDATVYARIRIRHLNLQLAREKQRRLATEAQLLVEASARLLEEGLREAGLDPALAYDFDDELRSITPHGDQNRGS